MSKLVYTSHLSSLNRHRSFSVILSSRSLLIPIQYTNTNNSLTNLSSSFSNSPLKTSFSNPRIFHFSFPKSSHRKDLLIRAFELSSSSETKVPEEDGKKQEEAEKKKSETENGSVKGKNDDDEYPSGEFEFKEITGWKSFVVKCRMLIAYPWQRVRKGSVLLMKLRGQISEQLKSRFSSGLSLPQICENFTKAAYDPRKSGIYLQIEPLNCKFIVGHVPICQEKEYYLASACGEMYCPPSAYFALYGLTVQSSFLGGKKRKEIQSFVDEGVFQVERLKEEGWITNILYDDEVVDMLKERLGQEKDEKLQIVDYKKYSRVKNWTLGLTGGKDQIAVIRDSGSISRVKGLLSISSSGIVGEQFIEKIRKVRESKRYKAVVIRIDSPGGDALAFDLMWREIKLLAATKPVVASMCDVAASGGYYMAMEAGCIVAEDLTLAGSIGVVTVEMSRPSPTLPELLSGTAASIVGLERTMMGVLQNLTPAVGVQARMDGIMFEKSEGACNNNPIFTLIKDYLSSI
ncbi:hypothetical protein MKX01_008659 [Papaver californicum]|nr:hypothetical protein MKX01_008659 [Papaver californicum]